MPWKDGLCLAGEMEPLQITFFFLRSTNGKIFEFSIGILSWLFFKKVQTSALLRPLPPQVGKRLQLGTPSPPKNCGRPLWTAPNQDLKPDKAWFTQRGSEYITTFKKSF